MSEIFNIYCDESCHLENDHQQSMVLGAVWCPQDKTKEISVRLREIKIKNGLSPHFEVKWTKVSPAKQQLYIDLVDYFFDDDDLHFRVVIVPNKAKLKQSLSPSLDHDTGYYRMYFNLLKVILHPDSRYRIYLDIKDTHGSAKATKLHDILCHNMYDFNRNLIERVQLVRSYEIEQMQLADLLIGTVSYFNRGFNTNAGKNAIVQRMIQRSGYSLKQSTLLKEDKVNVYNWNASEVLV